MNKKIIFIIMLWLTQNLICSDQYSNTQLSEHSGAEEPAPVLTQDPLPVMSIDDENHISRLNLHNNLSTTDQHISTTLQDNPSMPKLIISAPSQPLTQQNNSDNDWDTASSASDQQQTDSVKPLPENEHGSRSLTALAEAHAFTTNAPSPSLKAPAAGGGALAASANQPAKPLDLVSQDAASTTDEFTVVIDGANSVALTAFDNNLQSLEQDLQGIEEWLKGCPNAPEDFDDCQASISKTMLLQAATTTQATQANNTSNTYLQQKTQQLMNFLHAVRHRFTNAEEDETTDAEEDETTEHKYACVVNIENSPISRTLELISKYPTLSTLKAAIFHQGSLNQILALKTQRELLDFLQSLPTEHSQQAWLTTAFSQAVTDPTTATSSFAKISDIVIDHNCLSDTTTKAQEIAFKLLLADAKKSILYRLPRFQFFPTKGTTTTRTDRAITIANKCLISAMRNAQARTKYDESSDSDQDNPEYDKPIIEALNNAAIKQQIAKIFRHEANHRKRAQEQLINDYLRHLQELIPKITNNKEAALRKELTRKAKEGFILIQQKKLEEIEQIQRRHLALTAPKGLAIQQLGLDVARLSTLARLEHERQSWLQQLQQQESAARKEIEENLTREQ